MSIEKTASLIGVAVVTVLLGIAIFSREDRGTRTGPKDVARRELRAGLDDLAGSSRVRGRKVDFRSARPGAKLPYRRPDRDSEGAFEDAFEDDGVRADADERPRSRAVIVRRGDSFTTIAKRELGDARRYLDIQRANPGVDPKRLRVGQEIRLPGEDVRRHDTNTSERVDRDGVRTHRVRSRDTLSGISKRYYATATRWDEILDANRDKISHPRDLKPGMVLSIP